MENGGYTSPLSVINFCCCAVTIAVVVIMVKDLSEIEHLKIERLISGAVTITHSSNTKQHRSLVISKVLSHTERQSIQTAHSPNEYTFRSAHTRLI